MNRQSLEFLEAYDGHRVLDQQKFYQKRQLEYETSARQIETIVEICLTVAAVTGIAGAGFPDFARLLGVTAALLGALAVALTSWSEVIGFKVNAKLYRAAREGLERRRITRPDETKATPEEVAQYVEDMEDILLGEVRTWGEKWSRTSDALPAGFAGRGVGVNIPDSDTIVG